MSKSDIRVSYTVPLWAVAVGVLSAGSALGQAGVYAYPLKGQTPQQQQRDNAECNQWAIQQSGFNPARPPSAGYSSPPPSSRGFGSGEVGQGGMVRDAGRGAAMGAIGGAIAGDAGEGAAIGAAAGALFGGVRRANRQYEEQQWYAEQQQMAAQQYEAGRSEYTRAYAACMSARNYSVQ